MKRNRAWRRRKFALIKKRIWNRGPWKDNTQRDTIYSFSAHTYIPITQEYIKRQYRYAYRNEGKWRHPGTKPWRGCSPNCWICNPGFGNHWKDNAMNEEINQLDKMDFEEEMLFLSPQE